MSEELIGKLLLSHGPIIAVLAWFMLKGEKIVTEIRQLSHRIDGMTKAMLIDVISRDSCGPMAKQMAHELLAKTRAREDKEAGRSSTRPPV